MKSNRFYLQGSAVWLSFHCIFSKTKQGLQMAAWLTAAVTDTTPLNPRCSALPSRPLTGRGKNNRMSLRASKQRFFFSICTQLWSRISHFPSFPLHFLDPAIHSSECHVHPVACCRCFCPVLTPPPHHHHCLTTPFSLCKSWTLEITLSQWGNPDPVSAAKRRNKHYSWSLCKSLRDAFGCDLTLYK